MANGEYDKIMILLDMNESNAAVEGFERLYDHTLKLVEELQKEYIDVPILLPFRNRRYATGDEEGHLEYQEFKEENKERFRYVEICHFECGQNDRAKLLDLCIDAFEHHDGTWEYGSDKLLLILMMNTKKRIRISTFDFSTFPQTRFKSERVCISASLIDNPNIRVGNHVSSENPYDIIEFLKSENLDRRYVFTKERAFTLPGIPSGIRRISSKMLKIENIVIFPVIDADDSKSKLKIYSENMIALCDEISELNANSTIYFPVLKNNGFKYRSFNKIDYTQLLESAITLRDGKSSLGKPLDDLIAQNNESFNSNNTAFLFLSSSTSIKSLKMPNKRMESIANSNLFKNSTRIVDILTDARYGDPTFKINDIVGNIGSGMGELSICSKIKLKSPLNIFDVDYKEQFMRSMEEKYSRIMIVFNLDDRDDERKSLKALNRYGTKLARRLKEQYRNSSILIPFVEEGPSAPKLKYHEYTHLDEDNLSLLKFYRIDGKGFSNVSNGKLLSRCVEAFEDFENTRNDTNKTLVILISNVGRNVSIRSRKTKFPQGDQDRSYLSLAVVIADNPQSKPNSSISGKTPSGIVKHLIKEDIYKWHVLFEPKR